MQCFSRLALTFLFLAGCVPDRSSGGQGGSSGGSTSSSSSSSKSGGQSGSVSSGGSGSSSSSSGGAGSGGASASGGASLSSSGGDQGGKSSQSASSQTGGTTGTGGSSAAGGTTGTGGTSGKGGSGGSAGGSTGSGGTTGSSASTYNTAPTTCTFPSNWTVGQATYTTYTLPNPITACGYAGNNGNIKNIVGPGNFAAIPGTSSSDFNTSNRCGACIQIGNAVVTIVDECPYDGNNNPPCKANPTGHMDLSYGAAGAGNVKGDPNVRGQNQWKFVPCPVTGNVIVRLKKGNNNEIFIENEILPIASVTCDGEVSVRTSYGAWHFGPSVAGTKCEATDIAGRKIGFTVGTTQDQDVDTKVQFPKCL